MNEKNSSLSFNRFFRFCISFVCVAALLLVWAAYTEDLVHIALPGSKSYFYAGICYALYLLLWGIWRNYPETATGQNNLVWVFRRIDEYFDFNLPPHFGFIILSFSFFVLSASASGFWLVSPLFSLALTVHVLSDQMQRNKGIYVIPSPIDFLRNPKSPANVLSWKDRIRAFIIAFVPWALVYETFILIGTPSDFMYSNLYLDANIPFVEWTVLFYVATYFYAIALPVIIPFRDYMIQFIMDVWWCTILSGLLYFALPFVVLQKDFEAHTLFGKILMLDRGYDGPSAAFPAFHVIWGCIASYYYFLRFKKYKLLWALVAFLIAMSCLTTGNHSIGDVLAGIAVFVFVRFRKNLQAQIMVWYDSVCKTFLKGCRVEFAFVLRCICTSAGILGAAVILHSFTGNIDRTAFMVFAGGGLSLAFIFNKMIQGLTNCSYFNLAASFILAIPIPIFLLYKYFAIAIFPLLSIFACVYSWIQFWFSLAALTSQIRGTQDPEKVANALENSVYKSSFILGKDLNLHQILVIGHFLLLIMLWRLFATGFPSAAISGIYIYISVILLYMYFVVEEGAIKQTSYRKLYIFSISGLGTGVLMTCIKSGPVYSFAPQMDNFFWIFILASFLVFFYKKGLDLLWKKSLESPN